MTSRPPFAPDAIMDRPSKLRPLGLSALALSFAIVVMLVWPKGDEPVSSPVNVSMPVPVAATVPDIVLVPPEITVEVSQVLRRPVRLSDGTRAVPRLSGLVGEVVQDARLTPMLVQALSEGRSNAYIEALVSSGIRRGDFEAPAHLRRADGSMDTGLLFQRLLDAARQG